MKRSSTRRFPRLGMTAVSVLAAGALPADAAPQEFPALLAGALLAPALHSCAGALAFRYEGVLGTSLDMLVDTGSPAVARRAVRAALGEIERLSVLLSTRDPGSAISRLRAAGGAQRCAPEIGTLLALYQTWSGRTGGAISCLLQPLVELWRQAGSGGRWPGMAAVTAALPAVYQPGALYRDDGRVRLPAGGVNIDALGKAFIIDRALAAAAQAAPGAAGLLLNIGGDIAVCGGPWRVGVADPFAPADNDAPLAYVSLQDQAIATSAGYARGGTIAGRSVSHILDPRTGQPVSGVASSTALAGNAVTANALALALSILGPQAGEALLASCHAAALAVGHDRTVHHLGTPARFERVEPDVVAFSSRDPEGVTALHSNVDWSLPYGRSAVDAPVAAWPANYQVSIALTLKTHTGRRTHRPYVAIWVQDANGKAVRTLCVWGTERKYQRDLTRWWKIAPQDANIVAAVTRATRQPGKYTITWDGRDDAGNPLPAGSYTVQVEINREHGTHGSTAATLACGGAEAAHATGAATDEAEEVVVDYAKKEAP